MRKKLLLITLAALIFAVAFTGCNPKNKNTVEGITYGDIYHNHSGISQYTSAELTFSFPEGVSPFTGTGKSADYANAYIEGNNLLICTKSYTPEGETAAVNLYGVYNIDKSAFIGDGVIYKQFNCNYGLISLADEAGNCFLYNYDGTVVIGADKGVKLSDFNATSISDVIIPISSDYFVLRHDKNVYESSTYLYDVYKSDGNPVVKDDGVVFSIKSKYYGIVKYNTYIFGLKAVDDYLVSSTYYSSYSTRKTQDAIYYDLTTAKEVCNVFLERGTFDTSTQLREAFYLGDGKLYCYQQETSTKDNGYTFSSGEKYYKILIWTYDLVTGKKVVQSPDLIYYSIINKYNQEQTTLSNFDYIVKDGYSLGNLVYLRNADKTVNNDQYLIDSNLNVYVSAFTHAGTASKYNYLNNDARDVVLTFVDGIGFNSSLNETTAADLMVYDDKGNTILFVSGYFYDVFYNNGIVTAKQVFYDDKGKATGTYCAAFRLDGTEVFDAETRKYSEMSAYVGDYALAKTANSKVVLVDKGGFEVEDITNDIYTNSGNLFYKAGLYFTYTNNSNSQIKNPYGLMAYDGTVIFDRVWSSEIIDKRGTNKILIYTKDSEGLWYMYFIK